MVLCKWILRSEEQVLFACSGVERYIDCCVTLHCINNLIIACYFHLIRSGVFTPTQKNPELVSRVDKNPHDPVLIPIKILSPRI